MSRLAVIGISTTALYISYSIFKPTFASDDGLGLRDRVRRWFQGLNRKILNRMWLYTRTFRFGLGDNSNDSTADAASSSTTGGHVPYEQWRDKTYLNYINMRERLRRQVAEQSQIRIPFINTEQLGHPWPRNDSWTDRELTMMSQMQGYIQSINQLSRELRKAYEHMDER